ncbi:MAG: 50S ribosomal protein L17 [Caldilineaceae bacterium SB0666_bin_21]|nr:50S ribosomal protein L17 [Caldilineaceae bacterium SB0665_bin_21]MXZ43063.1 50S ribosomal protein L17 [Caldilineaceae bacterium SB0666_bin_21]
MSTRHRVRHTRLGKASGHSKANLRNLVNQLIEHERIVTTEARGRVMRREAERMVTKAKRGLATGGNRVHAYRLLMSRLNQNRASVERLFETLAPRYAERNGGYTRMIKLGARKVDSAPMVLVEFVDSPLTTAAGEES